MSRISTKPKLAATSIAPNTDRSRMLRTEMSFFFVVGVGVVVVRAIRLLLLVSVSASLCYRVGKQMEEVRKMLSVARSRLAPACRLSVWAAPNSRIRPASASESLSASHSAAAASLPCKLAPRQTLCRLRYPNTIGSPGRCRRRRCNQFVIKIIIIRGGRLDLGG